MKKNKNKINRISYLLFILVAISFIGIGYARVIDVTLAFDGSTETTVLDEVVITNTTYLSNNEADITNSKINYVVESMIDSSITLGSNAGSTITYQISIYNNTDKNQLFIGVITDTSDPSLYSNPNIGYSCTKLEDYKTIITPGETIIFELTFKYNGINTTNNILNSKLNFRFQEVPTITLSNENDSYTNDKMYPGYTEEYEFTVSNYYSENEINSVPMTYTLDMAIDSPLTAKIYDETTSYKFEVIK